MDDLPSEETEQYSSEHPLDDSEVKEFLDKSLPEDLKKGLEESSRPQLSQFSDEREREEAEKTKIRRIRFPMEDPGMWANRTMYEETFAVLPEYTLGGLLSHHNRETKLNERLVNAEEVTRRLEGLGIDIRTSSIEETLERIQELFDNEGMSFRDTEQLVSELSLLGVPVHVWGSGGSSVFLRKGDDLTKYSKNPQYKAGFLFLKAHASYKEELNTQCTDERLINEFDLTGKTKLQALSEIWFQLGSPGPVLDDQGTYKSSYERNFQEGLKKLAIVRASPDLSFLYEHFSAHGAINKAQQ